MEKTQDDTKKKQDDYIKKMEEEFKEEQKEHKDRLDDQEVKAVMSDLMNRVTQDHMDDKFEEALHEVATSIDQYVSIVNETSQKQYEDFNQNLKQAFAKNLEVV